MPHVNFSLSQFLWGFLGLIGFMKIVWPELCRLTKRMWKDIRAGLLALRDFKREWSDGP